MEEPRITSIPEDDLEPEAVRKLRRLLEQIKVVKPEEPEESDWE
jgi:hypothetical protein